MFSSIFSFSRFSARTFSCLLFSPCFDVCSVPWCASWRISCMISSTIWAFYSNMNVDFPLSFVAAWNSTTLNLPFFNCTQGYWIMSLRNPEVAVRLEISMVNSPSRPSNAFGRTDCHFWDFWTDWLRRRDMTTIRRLWKGGQGKISKFIYKRGYVR